MLFRYFWTLVLLCLCLIFLIGRYVEWEASQSLEAVIGELRNLTLIVWNSRTDLSLIDIVPLDSNLNWNYSLTSCLLVSFLVLADRIPSSWKQLTLGNRITSSRYNNFASLILNETLNYLASLPNLVTLMIGLIQAYNTSEIVKIAYPLYLNLVGVLILLVHNFYNSITSLINESNAIISGSVKINMTFPNISKLSVTTYMLVLMCCVGVLLRLFGIPIRVIKGNYVNLGVSIICWLFAIYQEWQVFRISSKMDEARNGNLIRRLKDSNNNVELIRAEYLQLGDTVLLREGEITPASLIVDRLRYICDGDQSDYSIGTYYDRETTGEDVSRKFLKGECLLAHRELTRPDLEISGHVSKYAELDCDISKMSSDSVPHFLDKVRIISDIVGFLLLLGISISISASAFARKESNLESLDLSYIISHILAAAISANVLIPSMRMTLLYNVYHLVLSQLYSSIKISRYSSIPKLENIDRIIFDKTGTLTEECLQVGNYHLYPGNKLDLLIEKTGWSREELEFALLIANNESNINPKTGLVWGTSPEECEIVKYWQKVLVTNNLQISNPLRDEGLVTFSLTNKSSRCLNIIKRQAYKFGVGKIADIQLIGETSNTSINLRVRQDGSSHLADIIDPASKVWSDACEKSDPRRSMSIAYCLLEDNAPNPNPWELVSIYSFDNPLRKGVAELLDFVTNRGLTPYILTGDGGEAAEEVSKRAGFPKSIVRLDSSIDSLNGFSSSTSQSTSQSTSPQTTNLSNPTTLMISGSQLESWLETDPVRLKYFLDRDRHPKVIYRASSRHKEKVAKLIERAVYVGDAANDASAIQHSRVGISLAHGAEICRLKADLVITSPLDLVDLLSENGYRDMLLAGGERLLEDVCWMGGLTAGCLVIGLHRHGFQFLDNSPLYLETWKPFPMLIVSSFQYTLSVLAYASSDCESHSHCWRCLALSSARWHLLGLICGGLIAWSIKHWYPSGNFSYLVLHALDITVLVKHSWHCCRHNRPRIARRRSGGLFGNQYFASSKLSKKIGFCLCILDSVPARCLLYGIFTLLGEGYF